MTGKEKKDWCAETKAREGSGAGDRKISFDSLRVRAQQLSLREQLQREHFLLARLNAAIARLIQAVEEGLVFEAIGEIIGNLIGSEEVAIFQYRAMDQAFSLAWSTGVEEEILRQFAQGAGQMRRAAHEGASQFRDRRPAAPLLPCEKDLTVCLVLKLDREVIAVIAILRLLSQKTDLEWADFELLKFLETYGAVAIQLQNLQENSVTP